MTFVPKRVRVWWQTVARFIARTLLVLFILAMAALPMPLVPFVAFLVKPLRRSSVPAEVLRSEKR